MSAHTIISAFPPPDSRIWRNPAHIGLVNTPVFVALQSLCKRYCTESLPQVFCGSVYHFRTPSPGGQQMSQDVVLPTSFFVFYQIVALDVTARHANASVYDRRTPLLLDHSVPNSIAEKEKDPKPCHSNLLLSHWPQPLDWPHAAIRLANRPCPAPLSVPLAQPSSMETSVPAQLSVPLAVSPSVSCRTAATECRQLRADPVGFRRCGAHPARRVRERLIDLGVCHRTTTPKEGRSSCVSRHLSSPRLLRSALRPAATRSENKQSLAAQLAASGQQCSAATPSLAQPLAPVPTCSIATGIPAAADTFARPSRAFRSHTRRRSAYLQDGVLRSKTQTSEALCSTRF